MKRSKNHDLEILERRRLLAGTVQFTVDASLNNHAISRFIYGVNQTLSGAVSNATLTRLGGNRWTAYNWENNASNAGSDYQYQNDNLLSNSNTPGAAISPTLNNASSHNAGTLVTVPINGYVSADKNGGGDVRLVNGVADPNYLSKRFKIELPTKGSAFTLTPSTTDPYVYEDEFVNWVKTNFPYGQTDPNRPIWFELDNEPDLWSSTHAEVHPNPVTYAELINDTIVYSKAIKAVEPNTEVFGPVNYGWEGYINLQNASDSGQDGDFQSYYLKQLAAASATAGERLIDALDVHWYPEATGGGVRITTDDIETPTNPTFIARLQAPRSLWDSTYTETSWITADSTHGPINLIPRLNAKINANYPGTKLAITEYNYGGGQDISGAIAEADVLGIYGRDGIYAANEWPLGTEPYTDGAIQLFRNYDGNNSTFGSQSISATTSDTINSSVYASYDPSNPSAMTMVAINKSTAPLTANIALKHVLAGSSASVYQIVQGNSTPQLVGTFSITNPNSLTYTLPADSVSMIKINLVAPAVTAASHVYLTSPNKLTFTFSGDVTGLNTGDVTVTPQAGGTITPTFTSYANQVATFTLPASLADGNYTATLNANSVSDGVGNAAATYSFSLFSLAGDANHDRHVDAADQAILTSHLGQSGDFSTGDFDGNGIVNSADQTILTNNLLVWLPAPGTATLPSSSNDDVYTLKAETGGNYFDLYRAASANAGSLVDRIVASAANLLYFAGGIGNDSLTVDYSNGRPYPIGGLQLDGGVGTNTLKIVGTANVADTASFTSSAVALDGYPPIAPTNFGRFAFDGQGGWDTLAATGVPLAIPVTQHLQSLTLNSSADLVLDPGSAITLVTRGLSLDSTSTLDLNDDALLLVNGSANSTIQSSINTARHGGSWDKAGITSAAAKSNHNTTLAVVSSSDWQALKGSNATFNGEPIGSSDLLVQYTYNGDANLDGRVNFDDYSRIDKGYTLQSTGWINGDFNGSGAINFDDYSLIDTAFTLQGDPIAHAVISPNLAAAAVVPPVAVKAPVKAPVKGVAKSV